jgi:regulator of nucleoside diphosphate kinase
VLRACFLQAPALIDKDCTMEASIHEERMLTELDHARLAGLVRKRGSDRAGNPCGSDIDSVLEVADLVASTGVPADVVTMYSQVLLADADGRRPHKLTLCYPDDAEPGAGFVSVLSPVGASLLGLRVGATARWRTPDGEEHAGQVLALLFQPEASGDYTL